MSEPDWIVFHKFTEWGGSTTIPDKEAREWIEGAELGERGTWTIVLRLERFVHSRTKFGWETLLIRRDLIE